MTVKIRIKGDHNQTGQVVTHTSEGPVTFVDGLASVADSMAAHLLQMPKSFEMASEEAPQTSQEAPGATQQPPAVQTSQEEQIVAPKAAQSFKSKK